MSNNSISIKPNNHRVYQCPNDKKIELLNKLICENSNSDILIVCSKNLQLIKEQLNNQDIKIIEDKDLVKNEDIKCEMLISYDMPIKAIVYMARISKATQSAVLLLDSDEQKDLYHIETLLGRAIKQEILEDFRYEIKQNNEKTQERKIHKTTLQKKTKQDFSKKKNTNKFLGYDENGKAKFSGKSGERNHRYDGAPKDKNTSPKKTGRKISIKALKKEDNNS
jgi:hypothetical protein